MSDYDNNNNCSDHGPCFAHSGVTARVSNLEKNGEEQWKVLNNAHQRIDGMKNWVIAGMTSLLLQLLFVVLGLIIAWAKFKGGA